MIVSRLDRVTGESVDLWDVYVTVESKNHGLEEEMTRIVSQIS